MVHHKIPKHLTTAEQRAEFRRLMDLADLFYQGANDWRLNVGGWEDAQFCVRQAEVHTSQADSYLQQALAVGTSQGPHYPATYISARSAVAKWLIKAPEQAFDDIAGNDEALALLRDAIRGPFDRAKLYKAYGMRMPKGALLYGPPGCGKTMFARAAASEMRKMYGPAVEFLSLSGGELQGMYVGETEGRIKAIFTFAREYKATHGHPLLVFIDEAEVILPDRSGQSGRYTHGYEQNQVATFLAEMDGIQESRAFVLLATNLPSMVDQAVLRDGRCDFKIEVKRPNAVALEVILTKTMEDLPRALGVSSGDLVFAAVEGLLDPNKVLIEASMLMGNMKTGETDLSHKHFLFEHIISGAMAASIAERAKRIAFARDKAVGKISGVGMADVVAAVNGLFDENKKLEHTLALEAFKHEMLDEARTRLTRNQ